MAFYIPPYSLIPHAFNLCSSHLSGTMSLSFWKSKCTEVQVPSINSSCYIFKEFKQICQIYLPFIFVMLHQMFLARNNFIVSFQIRCIRLLKRCWLGLIILCFPNWLAMVFPDYWLKYFDNAAKLACLLLYFWTTESHWLISILLVSSQSSANYQ